MLNKIRKPGRAKGIVAWVLFSAIILVFVFFGLTPGGAGIQKGGPAAIVNSKPISTADFRQTLDRMQQQMGFDLSQFPAAQRQQIESNMRRRALETLIAREIVAQAAEERGLMVPSKQLVEYIRSIPQFQEEGRFRRELYMNYLSYVGKTASQFEEQLQRDIVVNEMQSLFSSAMSPVQGEAQFQAQLEESKLNLDVVSFDSEQLEESIPVKSSAIREYLKEAANQEAVKSYYQTHISEYQTKEQVKARHILILADPKNKQAVAEANQKIAEAQKRLKSESFAKVAKEISQDTQSAKNGGDLGFFEKGRMVPAFEDVAFTLKKGQVSDPVQTPYGVHLIKVEDKTEASTTPVEKVEADIAKKILAKEKVSQTVSQINEALAAKNEKALNSELRALNMKWEETGEFSMSQAMVPVIGGEERVVAAAFELTQPGQLVPQMISSNGTYFILKLKKLQVAQVDQLKSEVVDQQKMIVSQRSGETFNAWIQEQKKSASIKRNEQLLTLQ